MRGQGIFPPSPWSQRPCLCCVCVYCVLRTVYLCELSVLWSVNVYTVCTVYCVGTQNKQYTVHTDTVYIVTVYPVHIVHTNTVHKEYTLHTVKCTYKHSTHRHSTHRHSTHRHSRYIDTQNIQYLQTKYTVHTDTEHTVQKVGNNMEQFVKLLAPMAPPLATLAFGTNNWRQWRHLNGAIAGANDH